MAQKTLSWAPKHAGELVSRLSNATTAQLDDLTHLKDAISRRVATLDAQKSRARKGRTVQSTSSGQCPWPLLPDPGRLLQVKRGTLLTSTGL